jgi:hypothetical protein|tara:strand:+ start:69 stop:506 length:438 start_codon:yes stop_codon:yes gene_type:complete
MSINGYKRKSKWEGVDPSKIRTIQREVHRAKNRLGLEETILGLLNKSSCTFKELNEEVNTNEYLRPNYIRQMVEKFEIQGYVVITFNIIIQSGLKAGPIRGAKDMVHLTWEGKEYFDKLYLHSHPWLDKNIIHASYDEFFKGRDY